MSETNNLTNSEINPSLILEEGLRYIKNLSCLNDVNLNEIEDVESFLKSILTCIEVVAIESLHEYKVTINGEEIDE